MARAFIKLGPCFLAQVLVGWLRCRVACHLGQRGLDCEVVGATRLDTRTESRKLVDFISHKKPTDSLLTESGVIGSRTYVELFTTAYLSLDTLSPWPFPVDLYLLNQISVIYATIVSNVNILIIIAAHSSHSSPFEIWSVKGMDTTIVTRQFLSTRLPTKMLTRRKYSGCQHGFPCFKERVCSLVRISQKRGLRVSELHEACYATGDCADTNIIVDASGASLHVHRVSSLWSKGHDLLNIAMKGNLTMEAKRSRSLTGCDVFDGSWPWAIRVQNTAALSPFHQLASHLL